MSNQILYNQKARARLLKGTEAIAKAVGSTLGPRGQNVAIDRGYDMQVVHDGVTVAKSIELKDPFANAGVRIVREAANKQVDEVGDGTTVVTILAFAIIRQCMQVIATGVNPMSLRSGLEGGVVKLLKELDKLSKPVKTEAEKILVATISAEDAELGKMVGEIIHKVGADGIVTVEESSYAESFVEHQEGMQFDKGWFVPYFVTDPARMEATVEDSFVVITDQELANINELLPLLNKITQVTKNVTFIAPDFKASALQSFVATKLNGGMNLNCVQAPLLGQKQKDFLQDLAILTGGIVITTDAGMRWDSIELSQLGKAHRITSTKDATIVVGGQGDKEAITERIESIKSQLSRAEGSAFEIEKLKERIAKLSSGVAVIKVGGHTEVEMKERKERALDAVAATKAAVEAGIVVGGETVFLHIREKLDREKNFAENLLYQALEQPFRKLVENAGLDAGQMIERLSTKAYGCGVDVTDGTIKDFWQAGIIDPVKVPKAAIKNAVSVAVQLMTTGAVIVPEKAEVKN